MKRVGKAVGGDFPALGEGGDGCKRAGLVADEGFEEGLDDLGVAGAGDGLRIEIGGFGADAEVEDALAVAEFDGGLAFAAAGEGEEKERDGDGREKAQEVQREGRRGKRGSGH